MAIVHCKAPAGGCPILRFLGRRLAIFKKAARTKQPPDDIIIQHEGLQPPLIEVEAGPRYSKTSAVDVEAPLTDDPAPDDVTPLDVSVESRVGTHACRSEETRGGQSHEKGAEAEDLPLQQSHDLEDAEQAHAATSAPDGAAQQPQGHPSQAEPQALISLEGVAFGDIVAMRRIKKPGQCTSSADGSQFEEYHLSTGSTSPASASTHDRVYRKIRQHVRRVCCRCGEGDQIVLFQRGSKRCASCSHTRCTQCPRNPSVNEFAPDFPQFLCFAFSLSPYGEKDEVLAPPPGQLRKSELIRRLPRSHKEKYPYGYPGDAFAANVPVHHTCHVCHQIIRPPSDHRDDAAVCEGCQHTQCDDCPRVVPQKVNQEVPRAPSFAAPCATETHGSTASSPQVGNEA